MATRPVVCSHSNPVALDDNPRNISDRLIEGIAKTGGLIGLTPVNAFLLWSRKDAPHADTGPFPPLASISQYVDVMDYIIRLVGIDYVGIGSDFTVGDPRDRGNHPRFLPNRSYFLPRCFTMSRLDFEYVKDFDKVSGLPILTRGTDASRLFFRRHRENPGRQLDARVPQSLELLT